MLCPVQGDCIPPAPSAHMPMLDQPETLVSKMTCYVLSRTMIVNNDSIKLLNLISTCFCSFSVQNMLCILIFPICIVVCYRLAVWKHMQNLSIRTAYATDSQCHV